VNNCSNHGACIEAELCKCDMGYNGTDCSNFSCEAVNSCSGNHFFCLFNSNEYLDQDARISASYRLKLSTEPLFHENGLQCSS